MNTNLEMKVLDAGGRYGIHPTWKLFTGELNYHLFEPDPIESARLTKKYEHRPLEVKVIDQAVAEKNGRLTIHFFRNRAMSSSSVRNPVSPLFKRGMREAEVEVVESIETNAVSIDSYCVNNRLSLDFLKLDTEGSEYHILQGAKKQLQENILGVRCEVSFDYIFDEMPLFSTLHDFMLGQNFYLLNLDYVGKGDNQNDFVKTNGSYGVLITSDAVWMKRPEYLFNSPKERMPSGSAEIQVMKYAAFCLMNNASDVGINILLEARQKHEMDFNRIKDTRLHKFLNSSVHKLFYSLKWQPGQSLSDHQETFFAIFGENMKVMNEFMESDELNPD